MITDKGIAQPKQNLWPTEHTEYTEVLITGFVMKTSFRVIRVFRGQNFRSVTQWSHLSRASSIICWSTGKRISP